MKNISSTKADVFIFLTAGFDRKTGLPSRNGQLRIHEGIHAMVYDGVKTAFIIGGKRRSGKSESELYMEYIKEAYPNIYFDKFTWIMDASATCTCRDLLAIKPMLEAKAKELGKSKSEIVIAISSYPDHMRRAKATLNSLGFKNVICYDSNEPQGFPPYAELIMNLITQIDPCWRWLGYPLVLQANNRLKKTFIEPPS